MITYTGHEYFDLTPIGVNKGVAAEVWAEQHGLKLREMMMIGDAENDLEVMVVVGHGVAVGNATEEVKAAADQVIGDVDQDGLAEFLEGLKDIEN